MGDFSRDDDVTCNSIQTTDPITHTRTPTQAHQTQLREKPEVIWGPTSHILIDVHEGHVRSREKQRENDCSLL